MITTSAMDLAAMNAIANDTNTLNQAADALNVHLVAVDFTPGKPTTYAGLTIATFNGSAAKEVELGPQQVGIDPLTGKRFVQLIPPVGGWYWECAVAPGAAETIFGYVVTNNANSETYGSDKLPQPVTISQVGESVVVDVIRINLEPDGLS